MDFTVLTVAYNIGKKYIFSKENTTSDQKLINKKILVRKLEALKVKPLKNKKLVVLMVEKEYNEPFWLIEPTNKPGSELSTLHKHPFLSQASSRS